MPLRIRGYIHLMTLLIFVGVSVTFWTSHIAFEGLVGNIVHAFLWWFHYVFSGLTQGVSGLGEKAWRPRSRSGRFGSERNRLDQVVRRWNLLELMPFSRTFLLIIIDNVKDGRDSFELNNFIIITGDLITKDMHVVSRLYRSSERSFGTSRSFISVSSYAREVLEYGRVPSRNN